MYGFPYIENGPFFISGHPCTGDPRKEVNYLSASTSPLPYTGNKSCIVNTILTVMPKHSVYIEPCMGSAEVFFRKPKAEREILNDYNGDLINLFRTIQSNKKLVFLLGRLYLSINSELVFRQNKERLRNIPNVLDDVLDTSQIVSKLKWSEVEAAAAFFENQVYSFSSTGQTFGIARRDMSQRLDRLINAYRDLIDELSGEFPLGQPIIGEQKQKDFIKLYGNILRLKNILSAFDQFAGHELLPERDFQDYQSVYLDLYQAYRPKTDGDKENINDDITFEIELIRQVEINIDYILMLVMKYHESNCKDKSILGTIDRAIDSSIQLRSKKDLIHGFINTVNAATDVDRDWQSYVQQQKKQELEQIIAEEKLKPAEAQRYVANAFRDGALKTTGTDIDQILPPVSRFGGGNRTEKKKTIIQQLAQFFEKYFGI